MNTITQTNAKLALTLCLLLVSFLSHSQTQTFTANGTFVVPAGVTSVTVEAWGGGGGGGGVDGANNSTRAGGGGSGGTFTRATNVAVTPGQSINVTVGAGGLGVAASDGGAGGTSIFAAATPVTAAGGNGGRRGASGSNNGLGGGASVGSNYNGGSGANAASGNSGAGGGGAGTSGNGGNGTGMTAGTAGAGGGGTGAAGRNTSGNGVDAPGLSGGGSGGRSTTNQDRVGGDGFRGQVRVTYSCPAYTLSSAPTASPTCSGTGAVITIQSNTMPTGDYTITYNTLGTTASSGNTATINFTAGTPGTASFVTPNLNVGNTSVVITSIASSYCVTTISTLNTVLINASANPTANAGTPVTTCATSGAVTIATGATAGNTSSVLWSGNGTGTFTNASSLTLASYTPSAADIAAGSVTLTLTAFSSGICPNATSTKTLTIRALPTSNAGANMTVCNSITSLNITSGASAANHTSVLWTTNGSGTFANANSLTTATYTPSASDKSNGSVVLTLTATATLPCTGTATSTKTLTFGANPSAVAGTAVTMCSTDASVNVTTGAYCSNYNTVLWSSSGTGTFANANSLSLATYTPSAADRAAGTVTLTLTALSPGCSSGSATKILTIVPAPTVNAGTPVNSCGSGPLSISAGATATNYTAVLWSTNGSGTLTNANSLTAAQYAPSPADIALGMVTLTLTATGNTPCTTAVSTKNFIINNLVIADAGSAITTCSTSGAINITAGATAVNYTSVSWTSSGSGSFSNANSLTNATYTPSAADFAAGAVTLTLTASNAGCGSDSSNKTLTLYATPAITGTFPATRTGAGTVILGASASAGTLLWYAAPTGGTSLGFGTSFTTPVISGTTTFYVEAVNGTCTSSPRTAVIATVLFAEIDVRGNNTSITTGDMTPSAADFTDFGTTNMTRTFTIHNTGAGVLSLGTLMLTGADASEFTILTVPNATVASGQTTSFTIRFNPTVAGLRMAGIKLPTNDTDEPTYDFAIQGTGVDREIEIRGNNTVIVDGDSTPSMTDWTDFGSTVATRTYTVRNLGNIALNIGAINFTGTNAADFSVTTAPASVVGAYGSTTFVVTFTPSAINDRYATIFIGNDDANESIYDFALHGYGIIPEIDIRGNNVSIASADNSPSTTDWTDFGTTTVTRTFTIYNQGNTILTIGAISFSGSQASEFSVTVPPASTVSAFGSTTFEVTFAPTATTVRNATISIINNDNNENPYTFAIRGTGVAREIEVRGNNTIISDGNYSPLLTNWTDFGAEALERTFTIRNLGNMPLSIGAITFVGNNSAEFTLTTPPASTVGAFSSTTFTVTFNQVGTGNRYTALNIANNDANENPYDFRIQAWGGTREISIRSQYNIEIADNDTTPSPLDQTDFGNVSMDGASVTVSYVIRNTGTAAMSVGAWSITGTDASDFSVSIPPASTIAAAGSSRFQITFAPTTIGNKSATFSVINNDPDENPYNFALAGTAVQTYKDTDGDGVTDNKDLDDDNDGIIDTQEQADGLAYPLTSQVQYVFLNETFGAGTTKGQININTPGASCTYCYEDGYGSSCEATSDLQDGEYTVNYMISVPGSPSDPRNTASWASTNWTAQTDHTGDPYGRMAIFNASYAAGTFYETRIDGVIPNVPITYSFWALNIMSQAAFNNTILPDITVEFVDLNNNVISSYNTGLLGRCSSSTTDNSCALSRWRQFTTSVNLGNVTSFIVRFKNNSTGGNGNDLALDDITITQNYIDTDGDGIANIFDLDDENDGIPDIEEAGFKDFSSGLGTMDLSSPTTWSDVNANGLHDYIDSLIENYGYYIPDTDYDGVPDYLDLDSDNDSLFDVDEAGLLNGDGDINGDGRGDLADSDRDGILDLYDNNTGFGTLVRPYAHDTDFDTIPDYLQIDSDWDGNPDIQTGLYGHLDTDWDGMIDGWDDVDRDGIIDTFDTNTSVIGSPRDLNRKLYLDFDGRNDYGQGTGVLGGLANVTMMGWINLNSAFNGDGVIVGQNRFLLKVNAARNLQVVMNGSTITYSAVTLNTAQWYHVGVTLGGGLIKLYLNGVNVSTNSESGAIGADASLLTLGKNPTASNQYFKGKIDEIRIFNRSLTDAQFQRIVYQEIQNNASQVRGAIIPKDVGSLPWGNLLRYYRMDAYKDDIIDDLTTASIDAGAGMRIYNHKVIRVQQAPMPFITERPGTFEQAVDSPLNEVRGMDIMDQDWSIVQVHHNITETANNVDLGMFVDAGVTITADNDIKIQNDWYLKLDGKIDLQGKSQLVQTANSDLDVTSAGSIERDQQGQSNKFNYNYWCSPVSNVNTTQNNTSYTVNGVMRDATNPAALQNINFVTGHNGAPTSPISIASYWIFKFQNTSPVYANWTSVGPNGTLIAGQGFTMKGSGASTPSQNFAFTGKPNSGAITSPIAANNLNLSGNPYPSALDANAFILANTASTTGTLYFWEHYSTNNTHILANYQGGYATRNLVGGTPPVSPAEVSGLGSSTRIPGRFIPVGQGFFLTGSASGGNIAFSNAQRLFIKEDNANSNFMFKAAHQAGPVAQNSNRAFENSEDDYSESQYGKLRIGFTSPEQFHRQVLLGFMNELATSAIEAGYDAPHIDNQPSDMYFLNGTTLLNIQGEGYFNEDAIYPIGIKLAAAGTIKFTLDGTEAFDENQEIYIHDNATDTYHSIRNEQVFTVSAPAGITNDRFTLRFKTDEALAANQFDATAAIATMYTSNDRMITITNGTLQANVEKVLLFNMLGQPVAQWETSGQNQKLIQLPVKPMSTGTYIVKVITDQGDLSKKVLIK